MSRFSGENARNDLRMAQDGIRLVDLEIPAHGISVSVGGAPFGFRCGEGPAAKRRFTS